MAETPKLTRAEAEAIVETKTAPRVTREHIEQQIADVEYAWPSVRNPMMCVCLITMRNGFTVHGVSAPASPANFDNEVGKRYAYDDAFRQLWPLEGYLLRQALYTDSLLPQPARTP